MKTLGALIDRAARFAPEAIALVEGDRRLTHRQLRDRASLLASALHRAGCGPQDKDAKAPAFRGRSGRHHFCLAQAYMLISMLAGTSAIVGLVQAMRILLLVRQVTLAGFILPHWYTGTSYGGYSLRTIARGSGR